MTRTPPDDEEESDEDEDDPLLQAVDHAAVLCSLGLDGISFLSTGDSVDRLLLAAVASKVRRLQQHQREALAVTIVNKLGEAMKK